jgi:hypothetical protein
MKKIKITKEQYQKLKAAGLINEEASFDTKNPVNKSFKKAFAGKDISNFEYIPEEEIAKKIDFKIDNRTSSIPKLNINDTNIIKNIKDLASAAKNKLVDASDNFKKKIYQDRKSKKCAAYHRCTQRKG